MTRRQAIKRLKAAGFDVLEQRGFYSHFLRVRLADLTTVECLDIEEGKVDTKAINALLNRGIGNEL
ncbi:MAG: hypothetical protein EOS58_32385 [Mesorhizobium sp.]|nr:MAG: hypothetical protein EOS58_32385 [Mesorhizobium sp.]